MAKEIVLPLSLEFRNSVGAFKNVVDQLQKELDKLSPGTAIYKSIESQIRQASKLIKRTELVSHAGISKESQLTKMITDMQQAANLIDSIKQNFQSVNYSQLNLNANAFKEYRKEIQNIENELKQLQLKKQEIESISVRGLLNEAQLSIKSFTNKSLDKGAIDYYNELGVAIDNTKQKLQSLQEQQNNLNTSLIQAQSAMTMNEKSSIIYGIYSAAGKKEGLKNNLNLVNAYQTFLNQQQANGTLNNKNVQYALSLIGLDDATINNLIIAGAQASTKLEQILQQIYGNSFGNLSKTFEAQIRASNELTGGQGLRGLASNARMYNSAYMTNEKNLAELSRITGQMSTAQGKITRLENQRAQLDIALQQKDYSKLEIQLNNLFQRIAQLETMVLNKARISKVTTPSVPQNDPAVISAISNQQAQDQLGQAMNMLSQRWVGTYAIVNKVRQGIRQAITDIKNLDKTMTDIAVVTDMSVEQLWGRITEYMSIAQQYGVTTQGVYEVSQLYYQQGLSTSEVMAATTETLKMARIAGMEYKDAADAMTVAIRSFKMEMSDANHVTDVYSKVAAITASDSEELAIAMSKTASSAESVGSSFENTTSMLAVMIETTRESAQNLGSALKSIISRYGEMKVGLTVDSEGEEIDYNKVDTALKSVGISIKDVQGQFRDFDDVIFELSEKWDSLDKNTQRYIATIMAGNRQQSRFIALVDNWERLDEVATAAQDSEDAGLLQYAKTLDSLDAKLNNIKTSFQEFYMQLVNGQTFKGWLDGLNNIIQGFSKLGSLASATTITNSILAVKSLFSLTGNLAKATLANLYANYKNFEQQKTIIAQQGAQTRANNEVIIDQQGIQRKLNNHRTFVLSKNAQSKRYYPAVSPTASPQKFSKWGAGFASLAQIGGSVASMVGASMTGQGNSKGAWLNALGNTASFAGTGFMMGGGVGALIGAILGLVSSIPALTKALDANTQAQEELEQLQKEAADTNIKRAEAKSEYETLKSAIEKVEELDKIKYNSEENYQEWVNANNSLVEAYPTLIGYIDEAGNSIADLSSTTDLLNASMIKAAQSNRDYYSSQITALEKELETVAGFRYVGNLSNGVSRESSKIRGIQDALNDVWPYYGLDLALLGETTPKIISEYLQAQKISLLEIINQANSNMFTDQNQAIFEALKDYGAIIQQDSGLYILEDHLQQYITIEKQLQNIYSTKQAAMQSGIRLASLGSTLDDSVESVEGYTSIITELGKLHFDLDDSSYQELANISVAAYEAIVTPFIELYNNLADIDREKLTSLYSNLSKYTFNDLNKLLLEDFGLSQDSPIVKSFVKLWSNANYAGSGKILGNILNNDASISKYIQQSLDNGNLLSNQPQLISQEQWLNNAKQQFILANSYTDYEAYKKYVQTGWELNPKYFEPKKYFDYSFESSGAKDKALQDYAIALENYNTQKQAFEESIDNFMKKDIDSFGEWLNKATDDIKLLNKEEQQQEYDKYVTDQVKLLYDIVAQVDPNNLLLSLYGPDGALTVSMDAAERVSNFFWETDKFANKTSSVLAREAANSRKDLARAALEIEKIDFSKQEWWKDENFSYLSNIVTGGLASLSPADLQELQTLLLSEDAGTVDWKNQLSSFAKEHDIALDLSKFVNESLMTTISTIIPDSDEFVSEIKEIYTKQTQGFSIEEADQIVNDLNNLGNNLVRSDIFTIEDGKLILRDFNDTFNQLYQAKINELTNFNDEINTIINDDSSESIKFQDVLQDLFSFKPQVLSTLRAKTDTNEFTQEALAMQAGLFESLTKQGFSGEMADVALDYLITTSDATYESFIAFLQKQADTNTQLADYYNSLIGNLEIEQNIKDRTAELQGSTADQQLRTAYSLLASKGYEGYTAEEIAILEQYLGVGEGGLKAIETGIGTGEYKIDPTTLAELPTWVQNAITGIIQSQANSAKEGLEALGTSVANQEELTTQQKRDILGPLADSYSDAAIEYIWLDYEKARVDKNYEALETVLTGVYVGTGVDTETAKRWAVESINRFKDSVDENSQNILDLKLALLEETISQEDLQTLTAQDSDFVKAYNEAIDKNITKGIISRASKIYELYSQYYDDLLKEGEISFEEARDQKATAAAQQFDKALRISEIGGAKVFEQAAKESLLSGDRLFDTKELGSFYVALKDKINLSIEDFISEYMIGMTETGEVLLDLEKLKSGGALSEQEYAQFQRNFIDTAFSSAEDLITRMASKEDVYTDEIESFFKAIGVSITSQEAEAILKGGFQTFLGRIESSLLEANIPQEDINEKLAEIQAQLIDLLLESISSGISSLSAGLEGTLSATEYQSLTKQYGLSGNAFATSKGLALSAADQQKLISRLYMDAANQGMQAEFGSQIWDVWNNSKNDAIEGYNDIQEAIELANQQIDILGGSTAEAAQEAVAYRDALQQAYQAAMLSENSIEFDFMGQDSTSGLTKNADAFINSIEAVKSAFASLSSGGQIGYNDFYNMMDFMYNQFGQVWEGNNGLKNALGTSAASFSEFVTAVVRGSEDIGKVDMSAITALGVSIDSMAGGMETSIQKVADEQIEYLTGIKNMLLAMKALEGLDEINVPLGFQITDGDGKLLKDSITLEDIINWDDILKQLIEQGASEQDLDAVTINLDTYANQLIEEYVNNFEKAFKGTDLEGKIGSVIKGLFGEDGFNWNDAADIAAAQMLVNLGNVLSSANEGQATTLGMQLFNILFGSDGNLKEGWQAALQNWLSNLNINNLAQTASFEIQQQINAALSKYGVTVDGNIININIDESKGETFEGVWKQVQSKIEEQYKKFYGENGFKFQYFTDSVLVHLIPSDIQTIVTPPDGGEPTWNWDDKNGLYSKTVTIEDVPYQISLSPTGEITIDKPPTMEDGSINQDLANQILTSAGLSAGQDGTFIIDTEGKVQLQINPTVTTAKEGATLDDIYNLMTGEQGVSFNVGFANSEEANQVAETLQTIDNSWNNINNSQNTPAKFRVESDPTSFANVTKDLESLEENREATAQVDIPSEEDKELTGWTDRLTALVTTYSATLVADILQDTVDFVENALNYLARPRTSTIKVEVDEQSGPAKDSSSSGSTGPTEATKAKGNVTLAHGNVNKLLAGAALAQGTLMGELGPELYVQGGQYHIAGANGPEFVDLAKDAIVFNHLQTANLLGKGHSTTTGSPVTSERRAVGAYATGNARGPAMASGIDQAIAAIEAAIAVWQNIADATAQDLVNAGGGGGGGGGDNQAVIEELQKWYNLSRQIANLEQEINNLIAERANITDGHEYLRNLRQQQELLNQQVQTQQVLLELQQLQLQRQADEINNDPIWSQFLQITEDGLLQYRDDDEQGALAVLQQLNNMSAQEQIDFLNNLGYTATDSEGNQLEGQALVEKFFEELQAQIDEYDALFDTVHETEQILQELHSEIEAINDEIRENQMDLEQAIYDVIVEAWEKEIEQMQKQADLIKEANSEYINGLNEAVRKERELYDENDAIAEREQLQRRLALLRRSGGSASEIAELEKQLDGMLRDEYFKKQEEMIEDIQEASDNQVELLEHQIELQEEALEFQQETGVIWQQVANVMAGTEESILAFLHGNAPDFFSQSMLEQQQMLEDWAFKIGIYDEERARQNYVKEVQDKEWNTGNVWKHDDLKDLKDVYSNQSKEGRADLKELFELTYSNARLEGKDHDEAYAAAIAALKARLEALDNDDDDDDDGSGSGNGSGNNGNSNPPTERWRQDYFIDFKSPTDSDTKRYNGYGTGRTAAEAKSNALYWMNKHNHLPSNEAYDRIIHKDFSGKPRRYAQGGLVDYTGPAFVDGSPSKPEAFLNAKQTAMISEAVRAAGDGGALDGIKNTLAALNNSIKSLTTNITKDSSSINIAPGAVVIEVAQLSDSYDVDELSRDIMNRMVDIASKATNRGVRRR